MTNSCVASARANDTEDSRAVETKAREPNSEYREQPRKFRVHQMKLVLVRATYTG